MGETITNLDYYMYAYMCKTGEHKITKENYLSEVEKMYNIVVKYDYKKLFSENNKTI